MNEVVKLREENEHLKYEIKRLRELLTCGSTRLPRSLRLLPQEEVILKHLVRLGPQVARREMLLAAISKDSDDPPEAKIVDVHVCNIRKKLGVPIIPAYGEGYYMPEDTAERLKNMLGLAA